MVDKINQTTPINRTRTVKSTGNKQNESKNVDNGNESLSNVSLLEDDIRPSDELIIMVEEKGVDFARKQLIREILLNKFGQKLQGSAEFEYIFEKLNERIDSIAELKQQYNDYLLKLKRK